jgi:predicted  nucleic acid-binding Zn-ribbon protein
LPDEMVDHYVRIARKHNGVALAEARDEACSMCSVRIRPHVMQQLSQAENEEIIHCETCTRILYYVEKPKPPAEDAQTSLAEAGNH